MGMGQGKDIVLCLTGVEKTKNGAASHLQKFAFLSIPLTTRPACHLVLHRYGGDLVGLSAGAQLGGYKIYHSFWIPASCIAVCTGTLFTIPGLISDFSYSVSVSGPSLSCTESGVSPCQHCMARSSAASPGRPSLVVRTVEPQIRPRSFGSSIWPRNPINHDSWMLERSSYHIRIFRTHFSMRVYLA